MENVAQHETRVDIAQFEVEAEIEARSAPARKSEAAPVMAVTKPETVEADVAAPAPVVEPKAPSDASDAIAVLAPTATAAEKPARASRTAPAPSEPVVARVVVGTNGAAEEEPKPVRRGWWSRK
jgi:ribonuclease E